jgi:hypothetical protein
VCIKGRNQFLDPSALCLEVFEFDLFDLAIEFCFSSLPVPPKVEALSGAEGVTDDAGKV